jgi:RpiR family glv operon transcriptional regulator
LLEEKINEVFDELSETDHSIWAYVLKNKNAVRTMTINDVANACSVSRTTIMRFSQKLGFSGFSEFKYALKQETDSVSSIFSQSEDIILENHTFTINNLKQKDFSAICELISTAGRIFIYGSGDIQKLVCNYIKMLFLHSGVLVYNFDAIYINEEFYNLITEDDVVILITLSGDSESIEKIAKKLKNRNVKTIAITKLKNSSMTKLSTENIYIYNSKVPLTADPNNLFESTSILFFVAEFLLIKYNQWQQNALI